jgi:hypothetical protein
MWTGFLFLENCLLTLSNNRCILIYRDKQNGSFREDMPVMSFNEKWMPVAGYENIYEVSSHGRIRSLDRDDAAGRSRTGKLLRPGMSNGYPYVLLSKDRKQTVIRIHTLVAAAFLGECPPDYEVNHKDFNRTNNHVNNLEYVTHRENIYHAHLGGRYGDLSVQKVQAVRDLVSRDPATNLDALANKLKVSVQTLKNLIAAETYSCIPNKDGSMPVPLLSTYHRTLTVDDVTSLQEIGLTLPEIGRYYGVEYSTPYQLLRRANLKQQEQVPSK